MTQSYGANSFSAFKVRATEGIGKAVCRNFVSATYPTDIGFGSLIEPRSPPQYTAWFSESTFTTATIPATSQYKVFYHIYAGENNLQTQGAFYSVFLRDPQGTSFYQTNPTLTIASGFIAKGDFASETIDFTAPTGYQELCIRVNAQESCGYKKVTTEFALNYINDQYLKEQASQTNINSEVTCVSGTPSLYSLVNPNLQAGLGDVVNPNLYNQGIVRVCSSDNPGKGTDALAGTKSGRWQEVGTCDDGRGQIKCYIDTKSIKDQIKTISIEDETLESVSNSISEKLLEERKIVDNEIKKIEDETDPKKRIARITNELIGKAYLNLQKAKLYLLRGDAYAEIVDSLVKKIVKKKLRKSVESSDDASLGAKSIFDDDVGEEERLTIETALEEIKTRTGSYSDNQDLIDKFYRDGLLTDAEYDEINGLFGFWEEDMGYVRGILEEKLRKSVGGGSISCDDCMKDGECTETECDEIGKNCVFIPNQEFGGFVPLPEGICEEAKIDDRENIIYNFKYRTEAEVIQIINIAQTTTFVDRTCDCGNDCSSYARFLSEEANSNNIDPLLLLSLMMQESSCNKNAESGNSIGLMQINSLHCGNYDLNLNIVDCKEELIKSPKKNIEVGAKILKEKYNEYKIGRVFQGCSNRNIKYYEWEAALRGYVGWGCAEGHDSYVEEVMNRFNLLNNAQESIFPIGGGA